jgi:hypothetical protein
MERMSVTTVKEVVARRRQDYDQAGRQEKASILNDLQHLTGYHRKSLVRLLHEEERPGHGARVAPQRCPILRPGGYLIPNAANTEKGGQGGQERGLGNRPREATNGLW